MEMLTEAITEICRTALVYDEGITVEGLLGITMDRSQVLLININEEIKNKQTNSYQSKVWEKDLSCIFTASIQRYFTILLFWLSMTKLDEIWLYGSGCRGFGQ